MLLTSLLLLNNLLLGPCVLCVTRGMYLWNFLWKGKSLTMTDVYISSAKKRKVLADESEILGHLPSSSVKSKGILSPGKATAEESYEW